MTLALQAQPADVSPRSSLDRTGESASQSATADTRPLPERAAAALPSSPIIEEKQAAISPAIAAGAKREQRTYALAMKIARIAIGKGRDDMALDALTVALSIDAKDPLGNYLLATIRLRRHQHHDAIKSLAQAQELDPENPSIHELMGDCLLAIGDDDQAMEFYQSALHGFRTMNLKPSMDDFAHFAGGKTAALSDAFNLSTST